MEKMMVNTPSLIALSESSEGNGGVFGLIEAELDAGGLGLLSAACSTLRYNSRISARRSQVDVDYAKKLAGMLDDIKTLEDTIKRDAKIDINEAVDLFIQDGVLHLASTFADAVVAWMIYNEGKATADFDTRATLLSAITRQFTSNIFRNTAHSSRTTEVRLMIFKMYKYIKKLHIQALEETRYLEIEQIDDLLRRTGPSLDELMAKSEEQAKHVIVFYRQPKKKKFSVFSKKSWFSLLGM